MSTTTERAPLLSDHYLNRVDWKHIVGERAVRNVAENVRDFYEAKITSGELRVVKSVSAKDCLMSRAPHTWRFACCGKDLSIRPYPGTFCNNCGAKIIE